MRSGESLRFQKGELKIKAPIIPKKFFHTAGNFREHHVEAQRSGFSHPVLPWIVFFQNVDAIIGPDEAIVYPEHLTQELDYELELALVLKKSGKHFNAACAPDYIGGYLIFNDITARDIQRTEMKSGVFSFCKGIDTFCPLGPHIVTGVDPVATGLVASLNHPGGNLTGVTTLDVQLGPKLLEVLHQVNVSVASTNNTVKILDAFLETALIHLPYAAVIVRLKNRATGAL